MDVINPAAQAYAELHTTPEDALLREVNDFTLQTHPKYNMLSGHLQGQWLQMISHMIRPRRILEIGTFTGYSGLCLAKGLTPDGELHTIELRDQDADTAQGYFGRSPQASQIHLHRGEAAAIIPTLDVQWDLVFIDADKDSYIRYFNLVFPKLRQNGFILADNVFFHGEVFEESLKGKNAKAIAAFNAFILERNDIEKLMVTLRDGLYLLRKL